MVDVYVFRCCLPVEISDENKYNVLREDVKREMVNWKAAYPEFKVFCETWCGRDALRMPHFAAGEPGHRLDVLESVEATLRANLASNGLVHEDVAWRNVGLYHSRAEQQAVVFDVGRVRGQTTGDHSWMNNAIEKLKREA